MKKQIAKAFQKVLYSLFVLSLLSTMLFYPKIPVHADEAFQVTDMSSSATVGDSKLNVRSGPGKDYDAIGTVSPGEAITVTGQTDNEWYRIDYSGKEGYVSSKYVTLGGSSSEKSDVPANDPNDFANYEEGSPQTDSILTLSPKMIILLIVIVVIIVIMISTIVMIKKNDEDEYDDEYDDDEYYEDDDYEDDEYEDDEYEDDDDNEYYEEDEDEEDSDDDEYVKPKKPHPVKSTPAPKKKAAPVKQNPPTRKKEVTEADYTLNIDPRIFEDEAPASAPVSDKKAQELDAAMSKLAELQEEIERLKNSEN